MFIFSFVNNQYQIVSLTDELKTTLLLKFDLIINIVITINLILELVILFSFDRNQILRGLKLIKKSIRLIDDS